MIHLKATIPFGFTDFKHCIANSEVDRQNDEFILKTDLSTGDSVSRQIIWPMIYSISGSFETF